MELPGGKGRKLSSVSVLGRRLSTASALGPSSRFKRRRSSATSTLSRSRPTTPASGNFNYSNIYPVQHDACGHECQAALPFSHHESSCLDLTAVLQMFSRLLSACEVKFTLELIDKLCVSRFGKYRLKASSDQVVRDLQLAAWETEASSSLNMKGPISIIQTVFPEISASDCCTQGEGDGAPRKGASRKSGRPSNDSLARVQDAWETTSMISINSQISKISKKSRGSQESMRRSDKLTTILSASSNDEPETEQELVREPTLQSRIVITNLADGATLPGEETVRDAYVHRPKSESDYSASESCESDGRDDDALTDGGCLPTTVTVPQFPHNHYSRTTTCLWSDPKPYHDRNIDLDDVSLEQAKILAWPSDRFILHPGNTCRVAWDLLVLVLIIWESITLPQSLAFDISLPRSLYILSFVIFAADVIACFTTGYYHRDLLIMRRRRITRNYLKTWFVLDMVSLFPWEEIFFSLVGGGTSDRSGSGNKTQFVRVLKLGKLMRVFRLLRVAKITSLIKQLQSSGVLPQDLLQFNYRMSVTKMFIVFGFLSHWAACVWGWIGSPETWRDRYGLVDDEKFTQYLAAVHFAAALITGGDAFMTAIYPTERLFTIAVMFGSLLVISSVVGEILLIINRQSETKIVFDEQIQQAQSFMAARKVVTSLQARVLRYMETQYSIQHGDENGSNRMFMQALPESLQSELIEQLNRPLIMQHPFFAKLQDQAAVSFLSHQAAPAIYAVGESICLKDEPATCAYWLVFGKVRVDTPVFSSGGSEIYLKPPCWLGDMCLFVDTLRKSTVTAVVTSEMLCLPKQTFRDACEQFPSLQADYEDFREIVMTEKMESLVCPFCHDIGHCEEQCPERRREESKSSTFAERIAKRSTMIMRTNSSA